MTKSISEMQLEAASKVAGDKIQTELFIYNTSFEGSPVRVINRSKTTTTKEWMNLYKANGFDVRQENSLMFFATAPFKVGA